MNRRNFFTRIATAIAVVPALKLTEAEAKAKPAASLPLLRPEQTGGLTYLILGGPRTGKTLLSLYLQDSFAPERCVLLEAGHYEVTRRGREGLVERVMHERVAGGTTIVVARTNREATGFFAGSVYENQNALEVGYLAEWTFLVRNYSMYLRTEGVLNVWHCETVKDRFGNKPRTFTYQKCGSKPLELCSSTRTEVL